ncbi:MAG: M20 family metallopeptidase [Candidatus Hermodarchaeota archaeon]
MSKKIEEWIETNREKFIKISDKIWSYAEIGLLEEKSSKFLADTLEEAKFKVEREVADMPTAFIASYGTGKPVIAILGEFDALPGLSQVAEPVKKPMKEGAPGHGCGHNLFGAACLAACMAVKKVIETGEVKGTIRFYGCPAEENADAKGWMVRAGLFDDVDISLTWHPADLNSIIAFNFQAIYSVLFKFHGRSAHAAGDPFNGRSALDAVELMNVGCNYLREHITPDARIHYVITNGGEAPNVVPAEAEVWYFIRAPLLDQMKEIYPRVVKVAKGAALMTETEVEIDFLGGSANLLPNITLEELLFEKMKKVGPPPFSEEDQEFAREIRKTFSQDYFDNFLAWLPKDMREFVEQLRDVNLCNVTVPILGRGHTIGGSTDVGDVSWVTPTAQFTSACFTIGTPGHSWQSVAHAGMSIGHKGMLNAAKILALAAIELMQKPELREKARKEFEEKIKKTPYECSIPDDAKPPIEYIKKLYNK